MTQQGNSTFRTNEYTRWLAITGLLAGFLLFFSAMHAEAQQTSFTTPRISSPIIAQASSTPAADFTRLPTDITPVSGLQQAQSFLSPETRFRILTRLPRALWMNVTSEVSQRLETNVLFTHGHYKSDYVFRALPNITLGYNIFSGASVYCNYFVVKDVYTLHPALTAPTTQSLALGFRQDIPLRPRLAAQLDFQARELWQARHLHQADLIPTANVFFFANPRITLFANALLQMRSKNYFQGATRELDPYYSVGAVARRGNWGFSAVGTLVTNFRDPPFHHSIPRHGNDAIICDFEINRPIYRQIPNLVMFVRAEPVFNWGGGKLPGLSGFDFRLYGGLRFSANKPSYLASLNKLRKQLLESQ